MKDYIQQAIRTESLNCNVVGNERLLHAAIGLATESGELLDALKKTIFYGKELDHVNVKEELGDLLWYIAVAMDELGTDFETEMERNIAKLQSRYPEKFTEVHAEERDLVREREILEQDKK